MNPSIALFFKRLLAIVICLVVGVYGLDYLWLQLRLESKDPSAAMDSVTRYDATTLKNGRVQIFFGQPEIQKCVRSLLPHLGYTPCWYLKRAGQDIKQISQIVAPAAPPTRVDGTSRQSRSYLGTVAVSGPSLVAPVETAMDRAPFFPTERTAKK